MVTTNLYFYRYYQATLIISQVWKNRTKSRISQSLVSVIFFFHGDSGQKKYAKDPFKQIDPLLIVVVFKKVQQMALRFPQKVKLSPEFLRHPRASFSTVYELQPKKNIFLAQHLDKIFEWAFYRKIVQQSRQSIP